MPELETVLYEVQGNVVTITMNRPEKRNAMNAQLNEDLLAALEAARDDGTVRAVVVTGAGKSFCAGADLSVFAQRPSPEQIYEAITTVYKPMMSLITGVEKPVIAAVNGAAAGAGAALALACDLRVMAEDAYMMQAFSNVGLIPDAGANWFLVRALGYSRAYQLAIEADKLPADRCLEWGLANKLAPPDALLEVAMAWALKLAKRPTVALGLTKKAMQHALLHDLASTIEFEAKMQMKTITTADHMEGVMAFLEKREPNFTGK